jgi:hypothetical protein
LLRHRYGLGGACDLEVVAAPAKVDDALVVRVLENAHEHAIAQALGIASQEFTRSASDLAGAN